MRNMVWLIFAFMAITTEAFGNGLNCSLKQYRKPVFMIHGVFTGAAYLLDLEVRIKLRYPCTVVHRTNAYPDLASLVPLQKQLDGDLGREFLNFMKTYPEGINLIGHSQGALLARLLLQRYPQHNVCNLISIAGMQAGDYGLPTFIAALTALGQLPPIAEAGTGLFYSPLIQETISSASYWKDPTDPELYLQKNKFLPYYNNEIWTEKSICYREALLKLKKFICLFGPDDGVIEPWYSGDFSYFNRCRQFVNITQRQIYTEDRLGLRTLDAEGRFIRYIVPGVLHDNWVINHSVIDNYIVPNLC